MQIYNSLTPQDLCREDPKRFNELRRSFCVPAALSIITGRPLHEIEGELKNFLGDNAQKGIFYPVALKVLELSGWKWEESSIRQLQKPIARLNWEPKKKQFENTYFVCYRTHAVAWINGMWFDNGHPEGSFHPIFGGKIEKVFRCWKTETETN